MNYQRLNTYPAGSPEWLRQRATRVGGSEVAAVLGLSPWESHFSLWHRKQGMVGPVEETPEMEWGKRLEAVVLAKFVESHPELYKMPGGTWTRTDRPWQIASPDAIALPSVEVAACEREGRAFFDSRQRVIIEIKTALYDTGWGTPGTDEIPVYYLCQVRWYMSVLDIDRAYVVVLIGGSDYREYIVERDIQDEHALLVAAEAFVGSLTTGTRPDIDGHSETLQVVRELHPDIDGADIDLDPATAEEYLTAEAVSRLADVNLTRMKATVLDQMGTAKYAVHADERIAYRTARTKRDGTPGIPYLQLTRPTLARVAPKAQEAA